jgi:hypothetical protein
VLLFLFILYEVLLIRPVETTGQTIGKPDNPLSENENMSLKEGAHLFLSSDQCARRFLGMPLKIVKIETLLNL